MKMDQLSNICKYNYLVSYKTQGLCSPCSSDSDTLGKLLFVVQPIICSVKPNQIKQQTNRKYQFQSDSEQAGKL